jgi:hypothetical protein
MLVTSLWFSSLGVALFSCLPRKSITKYQSCNNTSHSFSRKTHSLPPTTRTPLPLATLDPHNYYSNQQPPSATMKLTDLITYFVTLFFPFLHAAQQVSGATCLQVYGIKTSTAVDPNLGPSVTALVTVTPLPRRSTCTTMVTGRWTLPDNTQVTLGSSASGTRRRGTFPVYSSQVGTYKFDVISITCGASTLYTYCPSANDSVTLSVGVPATPSSSVLVPPTPQPTRAPVTASPTKAPVTAAPVVPAPVTYYVGSIIMVQSTSYVTANVKVVDAAGVKTQGIVVDAVWTLPDGTTAPATATVNNWGTAIFTRFKASTGTYTITVQNLSVPYDATLSVLTKSITV